MLRSLIALATTLALAIPASAQEWASNIVIPQSRVIVRPDHQQPIKIQSVEADVDITERMGSTTLRITLFNPSGRVQEAELIMPVPDGASIRYFELEGLSGDGGARLLPADEARRIYEGIVRKMQDPAILEFAGFGFVRSNVFPVPAGGTQTIVLTYEQLLDVDGDRVDYILPRTQSLGSSGATWTMDVRVRSDRGIATLYSPSHELQLPRHSGASKDLALKVVNAADPGSFQLSLVLGEGEGGTIIAYPDPAINGGYFMLLATPPAIEKGAAKIQREVTLVIDRSGSMRGEKIEQAKNAALQVIEGLDEGELFNIIDYSDTIESFATQPVAKNAESVALARDYVANIRPIGGTNIHDALMEALRQPVAKGSLPMILFLTDGLPTIGKTRETEIREAVARGNAHARRVFSFGVGFDVNAPLLTAISRQSRATTTFVMPDEDVEAKVGSMFRKLAGPVLASPRLTYVANGPVAGQPMRHVLPSELPDVFEGDQIVVVGQYLDGVKTTILVEGDQRDRKRTMEFSFDPKNASARNAFVPRLWASRKIASLIDEIRLAGSDRGAADDPRVKELIEEVVRLSMDFGIMTEYTAFLADETQTDFALGLPMQRRAEADVRLRALGERLGRDAVVQEMNNRQSQESLRANAAGQILYFADAEDGDAVRGREITNLKQVREQAVFNRAGKWIDARLYRMEQKEPDETVEFASARYFEVVSQLAKEGRQAMLADKGDVELLLEGKRVLVRNRS